MPKNAGSCPKAQRNRKRKGRKRRGTPDERNTRVICRTGGGEREGRKGKREKGEKPVWVPFDRLAVKKRDEKEKGAPSITPP